MKIKIIYPSRSHRAYSIAAETFSALALQVSGIECALEKDTEVQTAEEQPVVVIGTDAVNQYAADLYFDRKIDDFRIRYNTDDYRIYTKEIDGRVHLFLAGGRPRAELYAVYRYFEKYCGCRWFWDGDRIPQIQTLPMQHIDLTESPRFAYRGIRYFAHRSLHRFQAEQWSLEDWQQEIDWIVKKRLNLFMLRIGLDDLFQKAFPEFVPYPAYDAPLPEALSGYNDRNLFWSLEYRGELRKKLLEYAFDRDLMHPEDCGTMTHWYSRTPISYLQAKHPRMLSIRGGGNSGEATGQVWDIRDNDNLNDYFKLTDTHIRAYGKPDLFHTIGLAERSYGGDREEDMRAKLYVYRRISTYLKEKYPGAPLLIASWDLWMFYTPEEVHRLLSELDPEQSILLDYTSDTTQASNFTNWDVIGKFPWIFGIFSGYEPNSEIRGYYEWTNKQLKIAKSDPMCKGLVLWPELSHGDTLITEYLAKNAWDMETPSIAERTDTYCTDRYPKDCVAVMQEVWRRFMPIVQLRAWSSTGEGGDTFVRICDRAQFRDEPYWLIGRDAADGRDNQPNAVWILRTLSGLRTDDEMLHRDILDIARTVLGRYVDCAIHLAEGLYTAKDPNMYPVMDAAEKLMGALRDILGSHADFSLRESLRHMQAVAPTNPNFEITLKNNAENTYCRSYIYENAAYLYVPEMEILFSEVKKAFAQSTEIDRNRIQSRTAENRERFFRTPLDEMRPACVPELQKILTDAADEIESIRFAP